MKFKDRFIINEELSVSETVSQMTNELMQQLIFNIKKQKFYIAKDKNVLLKKGVFNFDCHNHLKHLNNLEVIYCIYYLNNESEYQVYENLGLLNCAADYENKNIKLSLAFVNNKPKDFTIPIRHELKHIYQYDCGAKKNVNFYDKVIERYQNGGMWEKVVAWALYLSFKTEQDAFLSQYYEYLKSNDIPKNNLKLNDINNPYTQFDKAFDNVEKLDINNEELKRNFGINMNQLYSILNSADSRLYKKMVNVWTKYINEHNVKPNFIKMNFLLECYENGIHETTDDLI